MRLGMTDHRSYSDQRIDLYRRKRTKNLLVAGLLVVAIIVIFVVSFVRMGGET